MLKSGCKLAGGDAACVVFPPDTENVNVYRWDGEGSALAAVCVSVCGCVCVRWRVYQLSASAACMTPEQADSHGSEVNTEPVWASWLEPAVCVCVRAHKHTKRTSHPPPHQTNITFGD